MLCLSRHENDVIVIDLGEQQIEIMVCKIAGNKVKIGVEAPKEIGVHRREVWEEMGRAA